MVVVMGTLEPLSSNGRQKPLFEEIGLGGNAPYFGYSIQPYDPGRLNFHDKDPLVRQKGFRLVEEMLTDPQIAACLMVLKYGAMARGWSVQPAEEGDSSSEDVADFVRVALEQMTGTIEQAIEKVLTAIPYGYSICEQNWTVLKKGVHRGKVGLKSIKGKKPGFYDFELDPFDNILALRSLVPSQYGQRLDISKFIVYSWDSDFENPYGRSIMARVYPMWWAKKNIQQFYMVYLDKFAIPPVIASLPTGSDQALRAKIEETITYLQHNTGIVVPDSVKFELLNVSGTQSGNSSYVSALAWFNSEIAKGILGQTLATNENQQTGSLAQAKVHAETLDLVLNRLRQDIEETIMAEQVIRPLVDFNTDVDLYPRWTLNPLEGKDMEMLARTYKLLLDGKVIHPEEQWIRQQFDMPDLDPDLKARIEVGKQAMVQQLIGGTQNGQEKKAQETTAIESEAKPKEAIAGTRKYTELDGLPSLLLSESWLTDYAA